MDKFQDKTITKIFGKHCPRCLIQLTADTIGNHDEAHNDWKYDYAYWQFTHHYVDGYLFCDDVDIWHRKTPWLLKQPHNRRGHRLIFYFVVFVGILFNLVGIIIIPLLALICLILKFLFQIIFAKNLTLKEKFIALKFPALIFVWMVVSILSATTIRLFVFEWV